MTEQLLRSIELALADDATPEARAAGATACRTILGVLESAPGAPLAPTTALPPASALASTVRALRGLPSDQLLDLLIAKLRTMVPADAAPAPRALAIPTIAIPRGRR